MRSFWRGFAPEMTEALEVFGWLLARIIGFVLIWGTAGAAIVVPIIAFFWLIGVFP